MIQYVKNCILLTVTFNEPYTVYKKVETWMWSRNFSFSAKLHLFLTVSKIRWLETAYFRTYYISLWQRSQLVQCANQVFNIQKAGERKQVHYVVFMWHTLKQVCVPPVRSQVRRLMHNASDVKQSGVRFISTGVDKSMCTETLINQGHEVYRVKSDTMCSLLYSSWCV